MVAFVSWLVSDMAEICFWRTRTVPLTFVLRALPVFKSGDSESSVHVTRELLSIRPTDVLLNTQLHLNVQNRILHVLSVKAVEYPESGHSLMFWRAVYFALSISRAQLVALSRR